MREIIVLRSTRRGRSGDSGWMVGNWEAIRLLPVCPSLGSDPGRRRAPQQARMNGQSLPPSILKSRLFFRCGLGKEAQRIVVVAKVLDAAVLDHRNRSAMAGDWQVLRRTVWALASKGRSPRPLRGYRRWDVPVRAGLCNAPRGDQHVCQKAAETRGSECLGMDLLSKENLESRRRPKSRSDPPSDDW